MEKSQDTAEQNNALQANCLVQLIDRDFYYSNLISANSDDPKKFWDSLRKVLHHNSEIILPAHSPDKRVKEKFGLIFFDKIRKKFGCIPNFSLCY